MLEKHYHIFTSTKVNICIVFTPTEVIILKVTASQKISSFKKIKLGKEGIILKKLTKSGYKSAVFLPDVPTQFGWSIEETLEHLSRKAGLASNSWQKDCEFEIFDGFKFQ